MRVAFVGLGRLRAVLEVAGLLLFAILGGVVAISVAPAIIWCFGFWRFWFGSPRYLVCQVAVQFFDEGFGRESRCLVTSGFFRCWCGLF